MSAFDYSQIDQAAQRLAGYVIRTPLLNSPMLDRLLGCEVFVKAESLQKTNSFKFRGALNMILQLSPEQLRRGVIAYSSGNHGQGVAAAAAVAGTSAVIVLPTTAASVKVESCRWWGAEIVTYDPATHAREDVAREHIEQRGMTLIPPFDHHAIVAGQGTAGKEICEQLVELGKRPDAVVTGCSGGGLASGVITAVRHHFPDVRSFIVEPQGYDKMARSLRSGTRTSNDHEAKTVMDALTSRHPGEKTFEILKQHSVEPVSVSDPEALQGVFAAFRYLRLVVEPGGAAALAALVSRKIDLPGKRVVVVCSGANIDSKIMAEALARHD